MTQLFSRHRILTALSAAGLAALAACGPAKPVSAPPPPPPKPVTIVIPPRPTPPNGAGAGLIVPPTDAAGLRLSVNRGITPAQITWNMRSAFNVAALNCSGPKYADILIGYRAFLRTHARGLRAVNTKVDADFRRQHGAKFISYRETYLTQVYNHFALPPVMPQFCDAVLVFSREALTVKPAELDAFAFRSLPSIEVVYDDFYRRYEKYTADLAAWEASYGAMARALPVTASATP